MKKIVALFVSLIVLLSSTTCFAIKIESKGQGISFEFSDEWQLEQSVHDYSFRNKQNKNERVSIDCYKDGGAYIMTEGIADIENMRKNCEESFSNDKKAKDLSDANGISISVSTDYVNDGFEEYNGVKYYKYEKYYTASARGVQPVKFYAVKFITSKNGNSYEFCYEGNSKTEHYDDFLKLLACMSYYIGEIKIKINNEIINSDSAPVIIEGRTLVPIRAVAEKMGYYVEWDGNTQMIKITNAFIGSVLEFQIKREYAVKDGSQKIQLDVPPVVIGGRTYLPVRAVAEAMSAKVNWNNETRTVEIYS
ncbi:MAG: copper amine oxidase N-terminal domain-containing protein [Clostridia bacterium]|nr:copper amine oxidase N-terminal domain-containing protein [Clostridia bacterium]